MARRARPCGLRECTRRRLVINSAAIRGERPLPHMEPAFDESLIDESLIDESLIDESLIDEALIYEALIDESLIDSSPLFVCCDLSGGAPHVCGGGARVARH